MQNDMTKIIKESFSQYAGAVLQSRALVDVRDCLKPSARQIFYCLYTDKFTSDKPFKKTLKAIGSAMRMYIHGDASCEGIIMRAGQPFAMRYPLIEVEGSYGNLIESGNWAAPRYTASRLTEISNTFFTSIDKNTIEDWRDNYDDTEKYPAVLPSLGYYNIVNGTMGIGVALASSIPQFNLKEVNAALIKLLWDENTPFEELYCAPDFATGGIILNENEIKSSLRKGTGSSIKLRSVINYNEKEKYLEVVEIPYGVYTNTICKQLEELETSDPACGITHHNDLTGINPCIKIYLTKNANPDRVLKYLYKNTSLQSYYGINMTMLDNGKEPKIFGWKDALLVHVHHEIECYRKAFNFDLEKYQARLHIVEGIIKAISIIQEVIETIRNSSSTAAAKNNLISSFGFSEPQAKAILDIRLARLAHLELAKYQEEAESLQNSINKIIEILNDEILFKKEVEKGFIRIMETYGDERRTKILNIEKEEEEPQEIEMLNLFLTNRNRIIAQKTSSLITGTRNNVGSKFKLESNETIVSAVENVSIDPVMIITSAGKGYLLTSFNEGIINLNDSFDFKADEECCVMFKADNLDKDIFLVTKLGLIKRGKIEDYLPSRKKAGAALIGLKEGDSFITAFLANDASRIAIAASDGHVEIFEVKGIAPLKNRSAQGVKAIVLKDGAVVVDATPIEKETDLVTLTSDGYVKISPLVSFNTTARNSLGVLGHKLSDNTLAAILPIKTSQDSIKIIASRSVNQIAVKDIPHSERVTTGVKAIKLKPDEYIKGVAL